MSLYENNKKSSEQWVICKYERWKLASCYTVNWYCIHITSQFEGVLLQSLELRVSNIISCICIPSIVRPKLTFQRWSPMEPTLVMMMVSEVRRMLGLWSAATPSWPWPMWLRPERWGGAQKNPKKIYLSTFQVIFGKNSDRPKGEVQEVVFYPSKKYSSGDKLQVWLWLVLASTVAPWHGTERWAGTCSAPTSR